MCFSVTYESYSIYYFQGHKIARLDGTMRHLYEREDIIKRFSRDRSYSIFLLTTQVGGVGLTLTAADRVVICELCTFKSGYLSTFHNTDNVHMLLIKYCSVYGQ